MTAFATLAGVYSTSVFGAARSREQHWMTTRALEQFLASVEKRAFKIAQLGLRNDEAAEMAIEAGLKVVQDRCLKIEHARFAGGLHLSGFDTGVISSKRRRPV